jgi:hypothetical protein
LGEAGETGEPGSTAPSPVTDAGVTVALAALGIVAGLVLLRRGLSGYRTGVWIGDTATSRISSLAAGEVRVTGTVEPAEVTLLSPLQSATCVWYRSSIRSGGDDHRGEFVEERGIGFRLRDATGTIRVFPRGARLDVADRFDEESGMFGETPPGLDLRDGTAYAPTTLVNREAAIAELLTVHQPEHSPSGGLKDQRGSSGGRRYREARLEPGDLVTIIGTALPFGQLEDPDGADRLDRVGDPLTALDDPILAAEIADARAAGTLLTPEEAWGNAAIEGFGIGRPVRAPQLDPGVTAPVLATPVEAAQIERTFDLEPDLLVLAAGPGTPLMIGIGTPTEAVAREQGRFLLGLLGAVLAIGSAIVGAIALSSLA